MKIQKDSYSKTSKEVNRPYKVVKFANRFALEYMFNPSPHPLTSTYNKYCLAYSNGTIIQENISPHSSLGRLL